MKDSHSRMWPLGAGLPALVLFAVIGGLAIRGHSLMHALQGPQDPAPPPTDEFETVAHNGGLLDNFFWEFAYGEGRYPVSQDELETYKNGMYFPVAPSDIINPYTHQPVQWISSPSPGDFAWISTQGGGVIIRNYYTTDQPGVIETWDSVDMTPQHLQQIIQSYVPNTWTGSAHTRFQIATQVWEELAEMTLGRMQGLGEWPPRSFDELVTWAPYLGKFQNPYGGYIHSVPAGQATPGNMTLEVLTDADGYVTGYKITWYYKNPPDPNVPGTADMWKSGTLFTGWRPTQ